VAVPAAAVDADSGQLWRAQEGYGVPRERCYTDAAQAFAENEADFVVIVVPPAEHERIVELAVAHGCHILSEKPIADTMEAAARIYHNVRRSGQKIAITMSHRFDQDKQTLGAPGAHGPVRAAASGRRHRLPHGRG
jgi:predicted dehydrogenase